VFRIVISFMKNIVLNWYLQKLCVIIKDVIWLRLKWMLRYKRIFSWMVDVSKV